MPSKRDSGPGAAAGGRSGNTGRALFDRWRDKGGTVHLYLDSLNVACRELSPDEELSSEACYAKSRHFLALALLKEMKEDFQAMLGLGEEDMAYDGLLKSPDQTNTLAEAARAHAEAACFMDVGNGGAAFNAAVSLVRAGEREEALRRFLFVADRFPNLAGRAYWKIGDLLHADEACEKESLEAYRLSVEYDDDVQGIHRQRFADALRAAGELDRCLVQYRRALDFDHVHIPELVAIHSDKVLSPISNSAVNRVPVLIEENCPDAAKAVGEPAAIYEWNNRFYAVPNALGRVSAVDLTIEGMEIGGWRGLIDGLLARVPGLHRLCEPLLQRVVPSIAYRRRRARIRSAASIEDLRANRDVGGLAEQWITGIMGADGAMYDVYFYLGSYFAVPRTFKPVRPHDLEGLMPDRADGGGVGVVWSRPLSTVVRWFGWPLRRLLPRLMRRCDLIRVRCGEGTEVLFDRLRHRDQKDSPAG